MTSRPLRPDQIQTPSIKIGIEEGRGGSVCARTGAAALFFEPIAGIRPPLCRGLRAGASSSPARHGRRRSSRAGCGRCKRRSTASSQGPVPLPQARKSRSSSSLIRPRFGNESTNRWWHCGIRTRRAMRPQHGASSCARFSAGAACAFADERSAHSGRHVPDPLLANLGPLTSAADPPRLRVRAGISTAADRGCVCPGSGSRKRGCRVRYRGRFVLREGAKPPGVLRAPVLGGSVFPASGSCPRAGPSLRLAMAVYGRQARFARREGRSLERVRCAFRDQEFPR